MNRVLYITAGPVAELHDTGRGHPERAARLQAVEAGVEEAHLEDAVIRGMGREATRDELLRVHDARYLDEVAGFVSAGGGDLDPDTHVSARSWDAALAAAGSGLAAVEALEAGVADSAFAAVRPPGHHATARRAMGFCLLNNVAITAAALAEVGERVLIVDWDVHHGNGTQDIFWADPRVMYVSVHQWPLYPGTGRAEEVGGPSAQGLTLNVPLPPGATGDVARMAFEELAAPAVERFQPGWVLVSAGYDAHRDDPLAALNWSAGDYSALAITAANWAPQPGRLVAFLEGGYSLQALARSVTATISAMAGEPCAPEAPSSGGPGREAVTAVAEVRRRCLDGF